MRRGLLDLPKGSDDFWVRVQKKWILLRGWMVRSRTATLPSIGPVRWTMAEAAGHGAFMALALSYAEKDVLSLRVYACSGIILNILFQYYRATPLWIPLRWNVIFLIINSAMIFISLKERNEAEYVPEEMKRLYNTVFKRLGMSKVDFMHMMKFAKMETVDRGEFLVRRGGERDSLYLVQRGSFNVIRAGTKVAELRQGQFVGERSWKERNYSSSDQPPTSSTSTKVKGMNDVVAKVESAVYRWTFADLDTMLSQEPGVALAFERLMSIDSTRKMVANSTESTKYRLVLTGALIDGRVDDAKRELLREYRARHEVKDEEHQECLKELGWSNEQFEGKPHQRQRQQHQPLSTSAAGEREGEKD